jgi:hypothetical protein
MGCGNVGISRSARDFQVSVETGLWFPQRRHFQSPLHGVAEVDVAGAPGDSTPRAAG